MKNPKITPPLRWVGGKQRLLPTLLPHIPGTGRLIEPFVGAGAVFLNAGQRDLIINDLNRDLVAMYEMLRDAPTDYALRARKLFDGKMHSQEAYLDVRSRFNAANDAKERAVMLLYLNRFGFNGLYRVNKRGEYNVPYGRPTKIPTFPQEQVLQMAARLEGAKIMCGDFRDAMKLAIPGDVVYCDPPYASGNEGKPSFTGYTSSGFSNADQMDLVTLSWEAASRGATVIISNHDTPAIRDLYEGMELHEAEVRRSVAANAARRTQTAELIAVLRPHSSKREEDGGR
jgi:DNA adenine methylase